MQAYFMYIRGMKTPQPRKPQVSIAVETGEKELMEKVAKQRGVSVSALVRLLVLDEARRLGIS